MTSKILKQGSSVSLGDQLLFIDLLIKHISFSTSTKLRASGGGYEVRQDNVSYEEARTLRMIMTGKGSLAGLKDVFVASLTE